jgi:hypothetical protein
MKKTLILSVAVIGLSAGGFAWAQEDLNQQKPHGAERVEPQKGVETPRKTNNEAAPGARLENNGEAPRKAQNEAEPKREAPRTGQATQPEMRKKEPKTGEAAEPATRKSEPKTGEASEPALRKNESRTGQAEPENRNAETRTGESAHPENRPKATAEAPEPNRARTRTANVRVNGDLHVSEENASRISETLLSRSQNEKIDINVNVGERLPDSVNVLPLPPEIVELAPEYRGYDYFVENDEIVFVRPTTHEVVGIIETSGPSVAASTDVENPARARPCPVE